MEKISKTEFKAHALEVLREIEQSGKSRIITDHGSVRLKPPTLQKSQRARHQAAFDAIRRGRRSD